MVSDLSTKQLLNDSMIISPSKYQAIQYQAIRQEYILHLVSNN